MRIKTCTEKDEQLTKTYWEKKKKSEILAKLFGADSDFSRRKIGKRKINIKIKIESKRTTRESGRAGEREENKMEKLKAFRVSSSL